jgi:hypothetical protein
LEGRPRSTAASLDHFDLVDDLKHAFYVGYGFLGKLLVVVAAEPSAEKEKPLVELARHVPD